MGSSVAVGDFNCNWLIIPFGSGSAPINEKDKALSALTTANAAVMALMQNKGITPPPGFGQNAGYTGNCVTSYAGPEEKDVYWYHPDHLGSSSFITGIDGEVNQNIEYFPSGETFVESHLNSYNTPYKFNSKELDDETGYYYYGARYYNPRVSLWLNVDPLASYDPIMNEEHYIDGQHNGGVYNSGNLNPYIYTYQNPVKYIDPNGKQTLSPYLGGFNLNLKHTTFMPAKMRTGIFLVNNPWAAARIGEYKRGSDNISSISTRFGTTGGILDLNTDSNGRSFDEGSERGAFRHTVWQAQITREFGADIAKQAGNAHEDNPNTDLSVRNFDNIADADQTVDLLNNIIGRRIGNAKDVSNLAADVLEEFKTNGLYQAKQNKDGTWSVNKQKLSPAKYQQYRERLNDMNYKGRTSEEQKKIK